MTISVEYLHQILDYEPDKGEFRWRYRPDMPNNWNGRFVGKVAGCIQNGYRVIRIDKKHYYYAHRLAWLWMTGAWPPSEIDHRNRIREDNRWSNLRSATHSQNAMNSTVRKDNISGLKGARYDRRRGTWHSYINREGNAYYLGTFSTPQEAHGAYCVASAKLHGQFGRI